MISFIKVGADNISISAVVCSDPMCSSFRYLDLISSFLPSWTSNQLVQFQFDLVKGAPVFILAYNSTIMQFNCQDIPCLHSTSKVLVSAQLISDLALDQNLVVSALGFTSLHLSFLDSNITVSIPMPSFGSIALAIGRVGSGIQIATSRWDPVNQSGIIQYSGCMSQDCDNQSAIDVDQFRISSGWSPSISLAEGQPGDMVLFYFKFEQMGLFSQLCKNDGVSQCVERQLHDGRNIIMNTDQTMTNFWASYWAWFVFGAAGFIHLLVGLFVRYNIQSVKHVGYIDIQDVEVPKEAVWY